MTTVLITSRPTARPNRVSAATYRRRRAGAVGALVGTITFLAVVVSGPLAGPGGVPASATGAQPATGAGASGPSESGQVPSGQVSSAERSVVVVPGDTLWSLAHAHRGEVAHAAYLDALVVLNGGASIEAGQRIRLP